MEKPASGQMNIVIVGGGTAGWLTAGLLASRRHPDGAHCFSVTLIEPPNLPPIGVGEGSWPTMRATLKAIGVKERDFLHACNASFKQGSKFVGWARGGSEQYYHPFDPPLKADNLSAYELWRQHNAPDTFSRFSNRQEYVCEDELAPKLATSPGYAGVLNYGYHFDSFGLSKFLKDHCEKTLAVRTIPDLMTTAIQRENGDVEGIETREHGTISGDFFVDCTGFRALLMKGLLGVGTISLSDILPANRAVTAQIPYSDETSIQSTTVATAQTAGWIWDVSLATRRGVGYVHSSECISTDQAAATLLAYLSTKESDASDISLRELTFSAGHLEKFWVGNCVGIGLAGGFIEPLEASSIMLTEISARALCAGLTESRQRPAKGADTFNEKITGHWKEIVDFLKLHYVLSERSEPFWQNNKLAASIPTSLQEKLADWQCNGVRSIGPGSANALFPLESYQYVWHGMLGRIGRANAQMTTRAGQAQTAQIVEQYQTQTKRLLARLPTNGELISSYLENT